MVMVPIDVERAETLEDPAVTTPEQRLATYWQHDHVRLYGRDLVDRVAAGGFSVEVIRPLEHFGAEQVDRCALLASDWLLICR